MRRNDGEPSRAELKFFLIFVVLMAGLAAVMWYRGYLGSAQNGRKDTDMHPLPIEEHVFLDPPKQIVVDDRSVYAENEALKLYQYSCYYYDEDQLLAEADYDKKGSLINLNCWEYDTAGNMCREQTQNKMDGTRTCRHIYEYDSLGRKVHEKVYWNEEVVEDNYFRYTDQGCAGVSYSYLDQHIDGGISQYCSYRTEYLEDENGNPLCAFKLKSLNVDIPNDVWTMQWTQQDDYMVNHVKYYQRNILNPNSSDWYRYADTADMEQFNLYEYNAETGDKNHILQLSYEWQNDENAFCLTVPFYRAQYEGNLLFWQMSYSDRGLVYYSACQYDADGRLEAVVEYGAEEDESYAVFYRYEYPEEDKIEKYSYFIEEREFSHLFGDGDCVLLTFSYTGILTGIEMTDVSGKLIEKYEFCEVGEERGRFKNMYVGDNVIVGEKAVLEKFEEETESFDFRVGVGSRITRLPSENRLMSHEEGSGE